MEKAVEARVHWNLFKMFLTIGSVSFGGYLALVAIIREKLAVREKLIGESQIADAIALGSLLPGPLAVNVVAFISYSIAGITGAIISVFAILLPSYVLVLILSIIYFEYNTLLDFNPVLMGILPVVIGIIFSMSIGMWKKSCTTATEIVICLLSIIALVLFPGYVTIILVILSAGIIGIIVLKTGGQTENKGTSANVRRYLVGVAALAIVYLIATFFVGNDPYFSIFKVFSQVSLTLFGGGYVMIPILKTLLVDQLNWVSSSEFVLGISLGQVTPGPILISSVFFGYSVKGIIGSILACIGIFLPSSIVMIIASKFYTQISSNWKVQSALRGIRPAVVGLIIYSGIILLLQNDLYMRPELLALLSLATFVILSKFRIHPFLAVFCGGLMGFLVDRMIG